MDNKEIILSKIAEVMSRKYFIARKNSEFKARLKCVGLGEYFEKYSDYLVPYYYRMGNSHKFENNNYYETYVTKLSTFHVDYTQIRFFINFFIFFPLFSFILILPPNTCT